MHKLMIDLETRSDADITKTGVYRYADSPYFDILLFAYSVDDAPVKVIDLASGESLPDDILHALTDDSVTKHSFNASFERVCLSVWLKRNYPDIFHSYSIPQDSVGNYLSPDSLALLYGSVRLPWIAADAGRSRLGPETRTAEDDRGQSSHQVFLCPLCL